MAKNGGFLGTLGKKAPRVVRLAKMAAVIGGTFLSVLMVSANFGKQTDRDVDHTKVPAVKQTVAEADHGKTLAAKPADIQVDQVKNSAKKQDGNQSQHAVWRSFGRGLASPFKISLPKTLRSSDKKADTMQPEAVKVATKTAGTSAVNLKVRERE